MENPYEAPDDDTSERTCPYCSGTMVLGYLHSGGTIRWYADTDSTMKKIFGNGEAINKAPITRGSIVAHRCEGCRSIQITETD